MLHSNYGCFNNNVEKQNGSNSCSSTKQPLISVKLLDLFFLVLLFVCFMSDALSLSITGPVPNSHWLHYNSLNEAVYVFIFT